MSAAVRSFRAAARFMPHSPEAWTNLATVLETVLDGGEEERGRAASKELKRQVAEYKAHAQALDSGQWHEQQEARLEAGREEESAPDTRHHEL